MYDYTKVYRSNSILTAEPGKLVLILFDAALNSLRIAKEALDRPLRDLERISISNKELTKTRLIIDELNGALDLSQPGEFGSTMRNLYNYFYRRLLEADMKKDKSIIEEIENLITEIRDAWEEMLKKYASEKESTLVLEPVA
jgi:flagellar protein FliS